MAESSIPVAEELEAMHASYRQGGKDRHRAPCAVYTDETCPHIGCNQQVQAIDFRSEDLDRAIHGALVRAWWDDLGIAGRCPGCGGWIHFTIRAKRAISPSEADQFPQLPDDWHHNATIL